ncbi:MAG: alpha/beta hydrolase [Gemmatimonadaceae bacterium]
MTASLSPSWQARFINSFVRASVRRKSWGHEKALVRRARRLFGAPLFWGKLRAIGLNVTAFDDGGVRGEWLEPPDALPGAILYVHGGGYVSCSPETHRPITAALAKLSRRRVFSLDYRLAPEHPFPAAVDDTITAYRWMLATSGIDPALLAVSGDSAGGGLTLALLSALGALGLPQPACAILGSPWTDLTASGASAHGNDGRCHMFRYENLEQFAAIYLDSQPATDTRASPLFADLSGLAPVLIQVGSTEVLLDDATRVDERIRAAGGDSTLEIYADTMHAWQMLDGIVPESRAALSSAARFISERFGVQGVRPA